MIKSQSQIKNWAEVLNEDYKDNRNTNFKSYFKTKKIDKGYELKDVLSPNVNKIVTDVGKLVSEMKKSEENLSKLNINSLINTKKQIKKSEKLDDEANSLVKIKEKEYKASLEGKLKKVPNYKYLSDWYRKQLNKALLNFNPVKHMANIHTLIKDNPDINKEFQEQTKIIDNEIYNITSPNFYRNQYKKYQKMFSTKKEKENSDVDDENEIIKDKEKTTNKKKSKNNIVSLPKIANRTTMGFHLNYKYYATETDFTHKIKPNKNKFNMYMYKFDKKSKKKKKSEIKRKFPDKEGRKLELELMEDVCKNMMNSINRVESEQNDFYNTFAKLNIDERKKIKDNVLKDKSDAEKILLKIKNNNLLRGINDDMDFKRKKINDDIKNYGKQINYIRDEILSNIEQQESIEHIFFK